MDTRWRVSLVAIAVAVSLGCGFGSGYDRPGAEPSPAATTDPVTEFREDVVAATTVAVEYWRERFDSNGRTFTPIRRVIPYTEDGEVSCGGEPVPRNNAVYCPAGDFVAYDVRWAAAAFEKIGDAFLYFLLGHEYAHGVQVRVGVRYRYTIAQELQADCMAGAYIGDSVRAGRLKLEPGDIEELQAGLVAVGDDPGQPWFAPGAHGNAAQRTSSFFAGYRGSVSACSLPW